VQTWQYAPEGMIRNNAIREYALSGAGAPSGGRVPSERGTPGGMIKKVFSRKVNTRLPTNQSASPSKTQPISTKRTASKWACGQRRSTRYESSLLNGP